MSKFQWHVCPNGVIVRYVGSKAIPLSNEIMRRRRVMFDHKNRSRYDNRKENLRECSYSQNSMNRTKVGGTSSKYKGVYWNKKQEKWLCYIALMGKRTYLGSFTDEVKAASAYNKAAIEMFKEFANLNVDEKGNIL